MAISLILLAGGSGDRFGNAIPKQYLHLDDRALCLHALDVFINMEEIKHYIVVCAPEYRYVFQNYPFLIFASPGSCRQLSVTSGLMAIPKDSEWVCIHDGVRPFIKEENIRNLFIQGKEVGAAALANPITNTVKQASFQMATTTLNRESLWEIYTPQFLKKDLLTAGLEKASQEGIIIPDDTSCAELLGHPVLLLPDTNNIQIKVTTPQDLLLAKALFNLRTKSLSV